MITVYFKDSKNMTELEHDSVQLAVTSFNSGLHHIIVPQEKKGMNADALRADVMETFRGLSAFLLLTSDRVVRRTYENIVPEIERVLKPDGVFILNVGSPSISSEADVFDTDLRILYPYIVAEDILRLSHLKLRREYLSIFRFGEKKPKMERWFMFSKTQKWKEREDVTIPSVTKSASDPIAWFGDESEKRYVFTPFPTNILRLLIKKFSNEGDFILDPCAGCYDGQTEVLTKEGWKQFCKIKHTDEIATLNQSSFLLEYQKPSRIIVRHYKGKMYHVHTRQVELLVTPDHRMFVALRKSSTPKRHWTYNRFSAEYIFGKNVCYKKDAFWKGNDIDTFVLPSVSVCKGRYAEQVPPKKIPMDGWLSFFGFWLAEGSVTKHKNKRWGFGYSIQLRNFNRELLEEMVTLLRSWGYGAFLIKDGRVRLASKQLFDYLSQFGKSWQKYIPTEIKNLDSRYLKVFLKYYLKGDGCVRDGRKTPRVSCWTSSERLRDDLQEIALKIGWSAYYSLATDVGDRTFLGQRQIIAKHRNWQISFNQRQNCPRVYSKRNTSAEEWTNYDGEIGCVEIPNHVIYVRRNGKPVWCGNTGTLGVVGGHMKRNVVLYEISINMQALLLKRLAPFGKDVNFVGRADSIGKAAQKLVPPL